MNTQTVGEKRADHRHTLQLESEIHFRERALKGMFRCSTSNVGLRGAFFMAENLPIVHQNEIDVVFHAKSEPEHYRVCAKLVRLQEGGGAVVFCHASEDHKTEFRRFLFKAKVAANK